MTDWNLVILDIFLQRGFSLQEVVSGVLYSRLITSSL